ncbi:DUF3237 domain-containing protein [Novosphingobium pokkalii]|uniref:DUF3237 domain-containing protein n=1 Tax=Novosphingobium pokkalii TaxID=1770194 RepID=UPI00363669A0
MRIELGERLRYGPTYWGLDRGFVGVLGGSVIGPRFSGKVIPHSGGDWPTIRPDNSVRFDARYLLQADDGTIVALHNTGIRHADKAVLDRMQRYEHVDPSEYYMGLTPRSKHLKARTNGLVRQFLSARRIATKPTQSLHIGQWSNRVIPKY